MVKKVKTKRTNKKKAIVGKHPITGKPETQEERDSRLRSVDYPRDKNGTINGIIHPARINQNWDPLKKGDPLFLDINGNTIFYSGDSNIYPVFIGEVAYKEKNIAMSYTRKEFIFSSEEWVNEFLDL